MRGVTHLTEQIGSDFMISTHTPHARRDVVAFITSTGTLDISTHTPHARRDVKD